MQKLIYKEWREDKVSFVTQELIDDLEGTNAEREEGYDFLEDSSISLEEKYAALDNWDWFCDSDSEERMDHPDYFQLGGNYGYIKFRSRVDKPKDKVEKPKVINVPYAVQQTFDFAS
jgi:hypothetical protein